MSSAVQLSRGTSGRRIRSPIPIVSIGFVAIFACLPPEDDADSHRPRRSPFEVSEIALRQQVLVEGLAIPFDVAIISDDDFFVTDRIGKLYRYQNGQLRTIARTPRVSTFEDPGISVILHGGLMDVALHPNYPVVPWVYLSYFVDGYLRVTRVEIRGDVISRTEPIFATRTRGYYGNGARIVWQDAEHFFLNIGGSVFSTISKPNRLAQNFEEDWSKIHRLRADGAIPADNPILPDMDSPTSIWSYGHRDAQGLHYDADSDVLYSVEHGPKGGDEFNVIQSGGNYGWPLFSHGIDYSGLAVSTFTEGWAARTTVLPEHYWTIETNDGGQSIAPAFLLRLRDSNFTDWNGKFLLSSLHYRWLLLFDRQTRQTQSLPVTGRIRSAAQLSNGDLLVLRERTSRSRNNGQLLVISPQ